MLRRLPVAALVFVMAGFSLLIPRVTGSKEKEPPQGMRFAGTIRIEEEVRASILAVVGPSEFFENLRSVDSPQGTVFMKDGGEVRFFPDRMTITLRIYGPEDSDGKSGASKQLNYDLMRGLKFKVQWKRGMKLRSVRELRRLSAAEGTFLDLENSGRPMDGWTYEMVFEDSRAPITDHLILSILSPDDKLIARMSAYL